MQTENLRKFTMQHVAEKNNRIALKGLSDYTAFEIPYQPLKLTVTNSIPEYTDEEEETTPPDTVHPNTDDLEYLKNMSVLLYGKPIPYRSVLLTHDKGAISTVPTSDVKLIFSKGASVFAYANNIYHRINDTINQLMASQLDPDIFYRISKECIVHYEAIHYITPLSNGDIAVNLFVPNYPAIIVSKDRARSFQNWMDQAESHAIHSWYAG